MRPTGPYPGDVSQKQFERIRRLLAGVRKRTKRRTVDLYEVFNAVLYLLKSRCRGAYFPKDFPNGAPRIRISPSGAIPARTQSAFWSEL